MTIKAILAACFFALTAVTAQASGNHADGHTHERSINAKQAEVNAQSIVDQLVEKKAIDASWKGSKPVESLSQTSSGAKFWQVTFKNSAVSDQAKQTLYVFLTTTGKYLAANHSGKY